MDHYGQVSSESFIPLLIVEVHPLSVCLCPLPLSYPQQVSTLAGNLVPSTSWAPELLFVIAVMILGLMLLALLIGNMSNFLQALSRR